MSLNESDNVVNGGTVVKKRHLRKNLLIFILGVGVAVGSVLLINFTAFNDQPTEEQPVTVNKQKKAYDVSFGSLLGVYEQVSSFAIPEADIFQDMEAAVTVTFYDDEMEELYASEGMISVGDPVLYARSGPLDEYVLLRWNLFMLENFHAPWSEHPYDVVFLTEGWQVPDPDNSFMRPEQLDERINSIRHIEVDDGVTRVLFQSNGTHFEIVNAVSCVSGDQLVPRFPDCEKLRQELRQ